MSASEYHTLKIDEAIRAETDRISDYQATGHFLRRDSLSFRVLVQPVHDTTQSAGFHLSLPELSRIRWALGLSAEAYARAQAATDTAAVLEDLALSLDASAEVARLYPTPATDAATAYDNAAAVLRRRAAAL